MSYKIALCPPRLITPADNSFFRRYRNGMGRGNGYRYRNGLRRGFPIGGGLGERVGQKSPIQDATENSQVTQLFSRSQSEFAFDAITIRFNGFRA